MSKIPVGSVIGQTYRFAFGSYFSVLGIVWLPTLVIVGLLVLFVRPLFAPLLDFMQQVMAHPDTPNQVFPGELFAQMWRIFAFEIVAMLIVIMIRVGIVKEALGLRSGPRFVYFSFGMTELRVIGAYLLAIALLYAVILGVTIVAALLAGAVGVVVGSSGGSKAMEQMTPLLVIVPLLVVCAELFALYVMIRLTYFIVAVSVAEQRVGLGRSWELTKGNFWRIVGVSLVVLLPLIVLECVVFSVTLVPLLSTIQAGATPIEVFRTMMNAMIAYAPYLAVLGFILAPVIDGLVSAPGAFAYRALVPAVSPAE